jgi:hypothetical protein
MPMTAATKIAATRRLSANAGKNGIANRRNPYVPILSRITARSTLPAGCPTCASGSRYGTEDRHLHRERERKALNSHGAYGASRSLC